jgi:outer membrane protein assembly factor BamB
MSTLRRLLITVTVLASLAELSHSLIAQRASADWPQWRGPRRDGSPGAFSTPTTWPDQLTQRWKTEVGLGYATPIVVGNRVYAFSRRDESEVMAALDAETGKELWKAEYPVSFTMHTAAVPHNKGPKTTPTFANGTLYAIGMTGVVTAFDAATGKTKWQKPASSPVPLYTTHAFSPLVDGNLVIFHVGGHEKGALTAFDTATGAVKWSWDGDGPGYGSPVIATFDGTRQLVTITQKKVVGVDVATGALLWERPYPARVDTNSYTPLVSGQTVVVCNGGPAVAFTVAKSGSQWTTMDLWQNEDIPTRNMNSVAIGDLLFGMTTKNSGQYYGVDVKSGKTLWTSPGRQSANAAVGKVGDLFYSLEDDGDFLVAKSSQTAFELVKKYKLAEGNVWAEAALSGNRIFVKDLNHITLWTVN